MGGFGIMVVKVLIRVYGQYRIETIHERRKRNREFSGLFVRLSIKVRK